MNKQKLIKLITDELGMSRQTAYAWVRNGAYIPAESCVNIERLTNGEVTAVSLRPDLFDALPSTNGLINDVVEVFESLDGEQLCEGGLQLMKSLISHVELTQPSHCHKLLNEISETKSGKIYLDERALYVRK